MKLFKKFFLALSLSSIIALQANAIIFAAALEHEDHFLDERGGMLLCLLILPICILEEDSQDSMHTTVSILKDNGYASDEIEQIIQGQEELVNTLSETNSKLVVTEDDTEESVRTTLNKLSPAINETYVNFFIEQQGF